MLKGQVFKEQIFENQIFAVFINTFLAGKNGIIKGYQDSMAVTAGTNTVTIQSGAICIQGRFLEEDTETTLSIGTDTAFCSLIVEINLDNVNTETDFTQGYYKIVKGALDYPVLTQNDIVNTNSGIYQYELARFKTSLNGISDFVDLRSYIDYESLYKEIENKLNEVEDGSIYVLKKEFDELKAKMDKQHPVGEIYLSMTSTNPSEYFGGTWTRIAKGRVLMGVDENNSKVKDSNLNVGSNSHTITKAELPNYNLEIKNSSNQSIITVSDDGRADIGLNVEAGYQGRPVVQTSGNPSARFIAKSGGSGQAMDITPLALTCYIWQRTA